MVWPDTRQQEAERWLKSILKHGEALSQEAIHLHEDPERQEFRTAAAAGALGFAEQLQAALDEDRINDRLLRKADLVATAPPARAGSLRGNPDLPIRITP